MEINEIQVFQDEDLEILLRCLSWLKGRWFLVILIFWRIISIKQEEREIKKNVEVFIFLQETRPSP